jgi:oligoribonuclease NrnB/cAMP/cGMP phosphodiesterase (DHH superfamily)
MRLYSRDELLPSDDTSILWKEIFNNKNLLKDIFEKGKIVVCWMSVQNEKYVNEHAFGCVFMGHPTIACNIGMANSKVFDSIFESSKYDLMLTFVWKAGEWLCRLSSMEPDGPDVSKIAKQFGGGGHKHVSGFRVAKLTDLDIEVLADKTIESDASRDFNSELCSLLNKHSCENASDTPDWILADFLMGCLNCFNSTLKKREKWYET